MNSFVNISCYKFNPLTNLKKLRERLKTQCREWGLKGTILLSPEGINFFVAGQKQPIERLLKELRAVDGLQDLSPKFSQSDRQPFNRMLVRIKKEIIAFGVEGINPGKRTSPKLPASELKQWIEQGREFTLLDTRNDYEIKLGTFKNAMPIGIDTFRDFPKAVGRLDPTLKEKPVVMFCTGGIRCEKAGPYMEQQGYQVHQLDGGILKYFEQVGGEHYDGECFVFDHRVSLDCALQQTDKRLCFACQTPLSEQEQKDSRYVIGQSCPYCFVTPEAQRKKKLEERAKTLELLKGDLPGDEPYQNRRPIKVPAACDGLMLVDFVSEVLAHIPKETWLAECEQGLFLDSEGDVACADQIVSAGERYFHVQPEKPEPKVSLDLHFLYEDEAIIVLSKPAPLPMHSGGRFHRNTLQFILDEIYSPEHVRPAHRLDANTTGLVALARTKHFAGILQPQFSQGLVEKTYLARVQGNPTEDEFECRLPISHAPGEIGSRTIDEKGLPAHTHFKVRERFSDGTTVLEVKPVTGRTNQIRVHLWALGLPICGDKAYLPGQKPGKTQTLAVTDPPLQLHAFELKLTHPVTRKPMHFVDPVVPQWVGTA